MKALNILLSLVKQKAKETEADKKRTFLENLNRMVTGKPPG